MRNVNPVEAANQVTGLMALGIWASLDGLLGISVLCIFAFCSGDRQAESQHLSRHACTALWPWHSSGIYP